MAEKNTFLGAILMLKSGNRIMIIHRDDITLQYVYYDFTEGKNKIICQNELHENIQGDWSVEWAKEEAYYLGMARAISDKSYSKVLGERKSRHSDSAAEFIHTSNDERYQVVHQSFGKRIEFSLGDNVLKILNDTIDSFVATIDLCGADFIIMRCPPGFHFTSDLWLGKRYAMFYARLSLSVKSKQFFLTWGDLDENGMIKEDK